MKRSALLGTILGALLLLAATALFAIVWFENELHMRSEFWRNILNKIYLVGFYVIKPLDGTKMYAGNGLDIPASLVGKTVIVTGGTKGCGYHAAKRFHRLGADVLITGRSEQSTAKAASGIAKAAGPGKLSSRGRTRGLPLDLSDFDDVRRFSAKAIAMFPTLDYLVMNAGQSTDGKSLVPKYKAKYGVDLKEFIVPTGQSRLMAANHLGNFLLTVLVAPHMPPGSVIVVVSSVTIWWANPQLAMLNWGPNPSADRPPEPSAVFKVGFGQRLYAISKLANLLFARRLRPMAEEHGITVTCLTPGEVATDIHRVKKAPGVPPSRGGDKVFEAAFVTRKPTPDFIYPYWMPGYILWRQKLGRNLFSYTEQGHVGRAEQRQKWDFSLHGSYGPYVEKPTEKEFWEWSRRQVGLPAYYDTGDIFLKGAHFTQAKGTIGAGVGAPPQKPAAGGKGGRPPPKAKPKAAGGKGGRTQSEL